MPSISPAPAGAPRDTWALGDRYEAYVGRWSRPVAYELLRWLGVPRASRWLDVGCGTGTLAAVIAEAAAPRGVVGVDRSAGFVAHARARLAGAPAALAVGDAQALPVPSSAFDAAVSGLVLNFVPEPRRMIAEMARATRPGGTVALYVWDYAAGMQLIRRFWDAARAIDPAAAALDEAVRFPGCAPGPLAALLAGAGLLDIASRAIDVPTRFRDLEDCWSPFLGGQGPAPAYVASLTEERRAALRDAFRASLPVASDGSIALAARAWAVRATRPGGPTSR